MTAVIETDRLCKDYGSARGIEDLTLSVRRGEVFGFLGPNGAGKTTTIRTLLDLQHPTSGTARVFGLDSRTASRAIRARLGNLPGEFAYDERMTGRELLTLLRAPARVPRPVSVARHSSRPASRRPSTGRCTISRAATARRSASSGALPRSRAARPRRADQRPGPAHAGGVPRRRRRAPRPRRDRLSLLPRPRRKIERIGDRVGIVRDGRLVAVEEVQDMRRRALRHVTVPLRRARGARRARSRARRPRTSSTTRRRCAAACMARSTRSSRPSPAIASRTSRSRARRSRSSSSPTTGSRCEGRLPDPRPASRAGAAPATALVAPSAAHSLAAVVGRGLRDQRSALVWGGGLGAMGALMASIWPSIEDAMTNLVKSYPRAS